MGMDSCGFYKNCSCRGYTQINADKKHRETQQFAKIRMYPRRKNSYKKAVSVALAFVG